MATQIPIKREHWQVQNKRHWEYPAGERDLFYSCCSSGVVHLLEGQVEQVDGFGLDFAALAEVFKNDSRWVVSQQKSLQLHFDISLTLNYKSISC